MVADMDTYNDGVIYQDYDSGAESDDFDMLELCESGEEFCRVGDQACSVPFELYDLHDLRDILSMDVWNNVLNDDERFSLAKYLPDMDEEMFLRNMKELFTCCNFHFGVPSIQLFTMLKGGLCEPRVALYRNDLGIVQKRHHYHVVQRYQDKMVKKLTHMRETLINRRGYDIKEKLKVLNFMKFDKNLLYGLVEEKKTDSSDWQRYYLQSKQKLMKLKHSDSTRHTEHIMKQEKGRRGIMQNEGQVMAAVEALIMLARGEEPVSDLSQQFGERDDDNRLIKSKWRNPCFISGIKSGTDFKRPKMGVEDSVKLLSCDSVRSKSVSNTHRIEEDLVHLDDQENKSQKKPFTLITPTVHKGFSFSIIHLLSAVRMAMITTLPEDPSHVGQHHSLNINKMPYLTFQEIVNRVKSNPRDPQILKTYEPLHDLVRGSLRIFSIKATPFGVKGWKSLVFYEKSIKSCSWVGPLSQNPSDQYHEAVNEATSPDAWGLPHRVLVKLVDSFANWLKISQEALQIFGSLPAPPITLMQVSLTEKERFTGLNTQKSPNTITQSSKEVKDYFRKEELIRYLIPDRAFAYTALDGKKSTVAPIRKGPGTPTSKVRDHFMLKRGRPSDVSIHCLVRDAAARLPGNIGTRADVCTLIRDSQYIVEDVSDAHLNDVVSGALDRLHYERDPCLKFDWDRKLWVYLHCERDEVDFEDDGTLSTKRWKRLKNESDINLVPDLKELPEYSDGKQHMKIDVVASNMCGKGRVHQVPPLAWQPMRKLLS